MRFYSDYWKEQIQNEDPDPSHIEHDMNLVMQARKLHTCDYGWEDLRRKCITETGKKAIHSIEVFRYHEDEYLCGML